LGLRGWHAQKHRQNRGGCLEEKIRNSQEDVTQQEQGKWVVKTRIGTQESSEKKIPLTTRTEAQVEGGESGGPGGNMGAGEIGDQNWVS
jgi:hypothetical protein